jgi:transposase-like protein
MRYPASEKLEIIRLVEKSHLPVRRTLDKLGIPSTTFYRWYDRYQAFSEAGLEDSTSGPDRVWNRIPDNIRQRIVEMASARYVLAWPSNSSSCEVVLGSRPMPSMSSTTLSNTDWTAAKCSAQPNANAVPGNSTKDTAKTIEATNVPDKRCCLIIVGPTEPLQ